MDISGFRPSLNIQDDRNRSLLSKVGEVIAQKNSALVDDLSSLRHPFTPQVSATPLPATTDDPLASQLGYNDIGSVKLTPVDHDPFIATDAQSYPAISQSPGGYVPNPMKDKSMANLTPDKRAGMPNSQFALPGKRFPLNDANHQRLAIGGATRAQHAGNISAATADRIKAEARAKLGKSPGGYVPNPVAANPVAAAGNPPMAHPRMHALTIAAATHLQNAGHLPAPQAARIKTVARANINRLKMAPQQPAPMAFGSLAPPVGPQSGVAPPMMAGPQRP